MGKRGNEREGTKAGRGRGQRFHCTRPGLERSDGENMRKRRYERWSRFPSRMREVITQGESEKASEIGSKAITVMMLSTGAGGLLIDIHYLQQCSGIERIGRSRAKSVKRCGKKGSGVGVGKQ